MKNSELLNLILKINNLDYEVKFSPDFHDMTRISFFSEYDEKFYEHDHVGCPGFPRKLEPGVIKSLKQFIEKHKTESESK